MILRRLSAELRAQNWTTIAIELAIVIVGVFIGTQVSNWNEARLQRRQTARMLEQLRPELALKIDYFESVRSYYGVTRKYADTALAGWNRDPRISDAQFVLAAYQASQIYGVGTNAQNWTLIFGGEQMRDIDDPTLRRHLSDVLTTDYADVGLATIQTLYRTNVRLLIPNELQVSIRATCGDRLVRDPMDQYIYTLPDGCALSLDPAKATAAAKALRASTSLRSELALHLGSVEGYLENVDMIEFPMRILEHDLDKRS
jgi:hypothetical protein